MTFKTLVASAAMTLALASGASALTLSFGNDTGNGTGTQTLDSGMDFAFGIYGNDETYAHDNILTSFSGVATADYSYTIYWNYLTQDSPYYDRFAYALNGTSSLVTAVYGPTAQSGSFSLNVLAGDVFSFWIDSTDNCCGAGAVNVSTVAMPTTPTFGFVPPLPPVLPAVPLPASSLLLLGGLAGFGAMRRRKG